MKNFKFLFLFLLFPLTAGALAPSPKFESRADIGFVENFHDAVDGVDLSRMGSDFEYKDLTAQNVKELEKTHDTKREFGKMFGFNDWKITNQKLMETEHGRVLVFEGSYKNKRDVIVSFLEVYWAQAGASKQFLLTSEKKVLKLEEYQEYLVP
ncbi:hypothetical protein ACJVC5_15980 [Peredibacter sp. HCB2-198]|uniref:hypothetical protein n=1 Tax=Peredibacter sp. HCB2-198 TaxID=3383025 RepID=UPI0038B52652